MPVKPVSAEKPAPTRKKMDRPKRTSPVSAGSTRSTKKMMTTKTPRVLNWRRRYAAAPSCTASVAVEPARAFATATAAPAFSKSPSRVCNAFSTAARVISIST